MAELSPEQVCLSRRCYLGDHDLFPSWGSFMWVFLSTLLPCGPTDQTLQHNPGQQQSMAWGCLHLPRDDPRGNLSQPQTLPVPAPLVAYASVGKAAMA